MLQQNIGCRKHSKKTKILSEQLGFSLDGEGIKLAKEIETELWMKERKVKLLSADENKLLKILSERFKSKHLLEIDDININNSEVEIEEDEAAEMENFEDSNSKVIKLMYQQLKAMQRWPLNKKIEKSIMVLEEAANKYGLENLLLSYSGGMDSEILSDITTRHWKKNIIHGFSNTTCEFPETLSRVREKALNEGIDIVMVYPEVNFNYVVKNYGFPMITKNISKSIRIYNNALTEETKWKVKDYFERKEKKWVKALGCPFSERCCDKLKKEPIRRFQKAFGYSCAIVGTRTEESRPRTKQWIESGCNAFEGEFPKSMPLSIWTKEDEIEYRRIYKINYSKLYDMGYERNGCMYCGYGVYLQKNGKNRIRMMQNTHPYAYEVFLRNYAKYYDIMKNLGYDGFDY